MLLEADFNSNNNKLGKDVMKTSEKAGEIAQEQFSGTKTTAIE